MTTDAPSPAPRVERGLYVPVVSSHMDHQAARTMILDHARAAYHRFARQHQREKYLVERTVAFHDGGVTRSARACVFANTRGAAMTAEVLGSTLDRALVGGLTEEIFHGLLHWLAQP